MRAVPRVELNRGIRFTTEEKLRKNLGNQPELYLNIQLVPRSKHIPSRL
jgi:hypothetical protein